MISHRTAEPKRFEAYQDDEYEEEMLPADQHFEDFHANLLQMHSRSRAPIQNALTTQDDEEFMNQKLTREDIKRMAEEIGEAMNQEYGEQDLSERRRNKRSARGVATVVMTGQFEVDGKEAAEKMREIANQTEIQKHHPVNDFKKEL